MPPQRVVSCRAVSRSCGQMEVRSLLLFFPFVRERITVQRVWKRR